METNELPKKRRTGIKKVATQKSTWVGVIAGGVCMYLGYHHNNTDLLVIGLAQLGAGSLYGNIGVKQWLTKMKATK